MKFSWPEWAKPSKAAAKQKDYRPVLQHGWIEQREDGKVFLCVTDSFMMAEVPLGFGETKLPDRPIPVPRRAMVAAEKLKPIEIDIDDETGAVSMREEDATTTYHLASGTPDSPGSLDFNKLWPEKVEREFSVGLSPKLLLALAEAIGAADGVKLTFNLDSATRSVRVEAIYTKGAKGLLMPMRLAPMEGLEEA